MAECNACHRDKAPLLQFSEYAGLAPATTKDSDGAVRHIMAPVFKNHRELCYPCYRDAVRADLARARAGRR